ncbi:hypothetical protein [Burkholderia sp. RF2-non_BP3]|uniref:hypothetical protein n=1 Tax=Burkholderia sp. RF2-non_BP3 TaxID=1637844 RepID=UPI00075AAEE8|nr:hypothetical protein [Burkholderia sp. RF2-non_BP3]KUY54301.1 hypothetical protein WS45_20680 [Burkholderia sp. RF2-non_BP3]
MANNNFKPFAAAGGANVMAQADYEALAALLTGFQSGTAQSQQLNKVWRQSSIMAAVLAQFIVDLTGQDAIDDGTTATLLANLKMAVQAQTTALVGQARNVVMNVTAASANATLTADEIVVGTALGGQKYLLKQFSKTINLASTGAGGMDTGSAPASGYVALYAIYNPTTGTSALLATNATSTIAPNVYGGSGMPAGYTASALVSVWQTNASGQFSAAYQQDRDYFFAPTTVLNTTAQTSVLTALSIASLVPKNAKYVRGETVVATSTATNAGMQVAGNASGFGRADNALSTSGAQSFNSWFSQIPLITPQQMYYIFNGNSGTVTFTIILTGYSI